MTQQTNNTYDFFGEEVEVTFTTYADNQNTAIILVNAECEIQTVATTNTGYALDSHYVAIKDYGENTGMSDFLIDNNIIHNEVITSIPSGHVVIPVFKLTDDANNKFIL
jgi:hypothetical protein